MKYRNFRNIVAMVVFAAFGGTCYGCYACWQTSIAQEEADRRAREKQFEEDKKRAEEEARVAVAEANARMAVEQEQKQKAEQERQATPGGYWSKARGLRPVDVDALALLDRPVVDKIKDGTKGKPYKINAYSDDKKRWNRLKVDLDRDEKSDESWTVKPDGTIERQVATKDDEKYDQHWKLEMEGWLSLDQKKAPPASSSPPAATPAATPGLRDVDNDMLSLMKGPAQEKVKDATKGKSYKINLYSDKGARFERAKVDLNRNDKWDESWTFGDDGSIERKVAPADDENYTEIYVLKNNTWQKK